MSENESANFTLGTGTSYLRKVLFNAQVSLGRWCNNVSVVAFIWCNLTSHCLHEDAAMTWFLPSLFISCYSLVLMRVYRRHQILNVRMRRCTRQNGIFTQFNRPKYWAHPEFNSCRIDEWYENVYAISYIILYFLEVAAGAAVMAVSVNLDLLIPSHSVVHLLNART